MSTEIQDAFTGYIKACYANETVPADQQLEVEKGFFGGALTMYRLVCGIVMANSGDHAADVARLDAIKAELDRFGDKQCVRAVADTVTNINATLKDAKIDISVEAKSEPKPVPDQVVQNAHDALTNLNRAYKFFAGADKEHRIALVSKALSSVFDALDMDTPKQRVFAGAFLEASIQGAADDIYDLQREGDVAGVMGLSSAVDECVEHIKSEFETFKRRVKRISLSDVLGNRTAKNDKAPKATKDGPVTHTNLKDAIEGLLDHVAQVAEIKAKAKADESKSTGANDVQA